jgi:hypothetical protein
MRRERIYRAIIFVTRVLRWVGWSGAGIYAWMSFGGLHRALSIGVGTGTSTFTTAELLAFFVAMFSSDRVLEMIERDLKDRLQQKA